MKTRVAVIGSCVSRLAFRSDFVPESRTLYEVVTYQFHTSIISLMSPPIPFEVTKFGKDDELFAQEHLFSELNKDGLKDLVASQPDVVILDFYPDTHFGVVAVGESYMTNKIFRYKKNRIFKELPIGKTYSMSEDFEWYMALWQQKMSEFLAFMAQYLPQSKILVNSARFKSTYIDERDIKKELDYQFDIIARNAVWQKFDEIASETFNLFLIDSTGDYFLDVNAIHGLDPLHFESKYYYDFMAHLSAAIREVSITHKTIGDHQINLIDETYLTWYKHPESRLVSGVIDFESEKKYLQTLSNSIEFHCSIIDFTIVNIRFEIKLEDIAKGYFFVISTFQHKFDQWLRQADMNHYLKLEDFFIQPNQWVAIQISIQVKGRYLRVGPFLEKNKKIKYRNISVKLA